LAPIANPNRRRRNSVVKREKSLGVFMNGAFLKNRTTISALKIFSEVKRAVLWRVRTAFQNGFSIFSASLIVI
jgi:hypothetical protein